MPKRFNMDIRKPHLSALICNSQITRNEALAKLESSQEDGTPLEDDKIFVLKKLGLTAEEFTACMFSPITSHLDFKSEIRIKETYNRIIKIFKLGHFLKISNRT
jgi:aminotransferase